MIDPFELTDVHDVTIEDPVGLDCFILFYFVLFCFVLGWVGLCFFCLWFWF